MRVKQTFLHEDNKIPADVLFIASICNILQIILKLTSKIIIQDEEDI